MMGLFKFGSKEKEKKQETSSTVATTPRPSSPAATTTLSNANSPSSNDSIKRVASFSNVSQPLDLESVMTNIEANGVLTSQKTNSGKDVDLLLQLFKSDFFDSWMAIVYLHRFDKKSGVHDYLSNQLYSLPNAQIEFYLPQITNLLLYRLPADNLSKLSKFLLRKSKESTHFALILIALVDAVIQENKPDTAARAKKIKSKLMKVMNGEKRVDEISDCDSIGSGVHSRTTSGNLPTDTAWTDRDELSADSQAQTADVAELCMNCEEKANLYCVECDEYYCNECGKVFHKNKAKKGHTLDLIAQKKFSSANVAVSQAMMFNDCRTFIDVLSEIAAHMISLQPQQRTATLRVELDKLNQAIASPFNGDAILFSALYVPMQLLVSSNVYRIVTIDVPECVCFSSKERAPFLLIMEVLLTERTQYPDKSSSNNSNNLSSSFNSSPSNALLNAGDELDAPQHISNSTLDNNNNNNNNNSSSSSSDAGSVNGDSPNSGNSSSTPDATTTTTSSAGEINLVQLAAERKSKLRPVFGEMWEDRKVRIKNNSPYGHLPNWHVVSMIFKYGDDIRQEALAIQMIQQFMTVFQLEELPLYLRPYKILVTSSKSAFVETVTDAVSIDSLKKKFPNFTTLADYFQRIYSDEFSFREAQKNFVESMAGYSVVCYILQIKDRHNGNLMLDTAGHLVHIDFGFMLDHSPGNINFEGTCFKLSREFIDVMGGVDSDMFQYFRSLVLRGFMAIRKYIERIVTLAEMMLPGPSMACFVKGGGARVIQSLRDRFNVNKPEGEFIEWVFALIEESIDNWRTKKYDDFQKLTNGIL